jgi:hypothetical protein
VDIGVVLQRQRAQEKQVVKQRDQGAEQNRADPGGEPRQNREQGEAQKWCGWYLDAHVRQGY